MCSENNKQVVTSPAAGYQAGRAVHVGHHGEDGVVGALCVRVLGHLLLQQRPQCFSAHLPAQCVDVQATRTGDEMAGHR